jgi:hypothetical protein
MMICEEVVLAYFQVLCRHLREESERNQKKDHDGWEL